MQGTADNENGTYSCYNAQWRSEEGDGKKQASARPGGNGGSQRLAPTDTCDGGSLVVKR
ncbi:hypothetical protein KVT40_003546 [Elsinoe batatas]|uniref:Uncharacterized protein n=1 Tax=Elsinoe batatas TaxID=2601811 RepID=A0A8K0PHP8_9PEZI|nr:hypothetical protein KVT40_003546 [Elsinoe batatas]